MKLKELLMVINVGRGNSFYIHNKEKRFSEQVYVSYRDCIDCKELMEKCESVLNDNVIKFNINTSAINIWLE